MTLFGIGFGGYWMIMTPALADVIDEIVLKNGKRNDGIFMGFRAFFGRLAYGVQALTFWFIHDLTGFNPEADVQSESALLGIHLHMALVPVILLIAGVIIFWFTNDLTKEKLSKIQQDLKEKGL